VSLSGIVRGPILCVGLARDLDRLSNNCLTVCRSLTHERVFNCQNVFALRVAKLEVWTRTARCLGIGIHFVFAVSRLTWN
jgi:hypothetical protein